MHDYQEVTVDDMAIDITSPLGFLRERLQKRMSPP